MPLDEKQLAVLEALGPDNVRTRLSSHHYTSDASVVPGLGDGMMARRDVEEWLAGYDRKADQERKDTLLWARIAGWAAVAAALFTAAQLLGR